MKKNDKSNNFKNASFVTVIIMITVFLVLGGATYAWFTSNTKVETSRVTARTNEENFVLLVSASSDPFKGSDECDITQVNTQNQEKLLPVSTLDLSTFIYSKGGDANGAKSFDKVTDEKYYYHGRIYIKAEGSGQISDKKMSVFLDNSDGLLIPDLNSDILAASRLGLKISDSEYTVFALSDSKLATRKNNTYLNGNVQAEGTVLTYSGSKIVTADDPAVSFPDSGKLSDKPVFEIEVNKIYPVDIYFYLEGCDPDCVDDISLDGVTFSLNFMGVLGE